MPPTGIPARLKAVERRLTEIEELLLADKRPAEKALREAKRVLRLCLQAPQRLSAIEDAIEELQRRR